ncbi:MAG TPA: hypothetical protein VHV76_11455 [Mycobacteriales bacterium]|nr:hypothetical protein [Mycobacteriales bacterium]
MRATVRSVLRVLLLVAMLGGLGSAVGLSSAAAAGRLATTSATPGVPTSTIKAINGDTATYCVDNYAPNSTVTIVNKSNNAVGTIHTDGTGSGCTTIHLNQACSQTLHETIVATGADAKGKPATSQAIADVPADPSLCPTSSPTPTPTPTKTCDPTQATLSIYIVAQGHFIRGTACGFLPGEIVELYILSKPHFVGNTLARNDSIATKGTVIPKCLAPGHHTFELVGETSHHVATAEFTITKAPGCANNAVAGAGGSTGAGGGGVLPADANQGGGPTGGLAFTGADILAMVLVALVLLALGIIATVSVRRRRTAPAA